MDQGPSNFAQECSFPSTPTAWKAEQSAAEIALKDIKGSSDHVG